MLHDDFSNIIANSEYGGGHIVSFPQQFWHFGKCQDPVLSYTPDGFFTWGPYAVGSYYWLSSSSVNLLAKAVLMYDRYFEFERAEDRAIGNVLSHCGIRPTRVVLTTRSLKLSGTGT